MPIFVQRFFLHGPITKFSIFPRSIVPLIEILPFKRTLASFNYNITKYIEL